MVKRVPNSRSKSSMFWKLSVVLVLISLVFIKCPGSTPKDPDPKPDTTKRATGDTLLKATDTTHK